MNMNVQVTFDGLPVSVLREHEIVVSAPFSETILLSGKVSIQALSEKRFARSYECYTEDMNEISNLLTKLGSAGDLVIGSETYSNCYIQPPFTYKEIIGGSGKYTYTINFVRDDSI